MLPATPCDASPWQQDCCGGSTGGRPEQGQDQGRGLLVLLDGDLVPHDVVRRLGARAPWDLLLIDSGSSTMRALTWQILIAAESW